ncbi:MAG: glutathione S-transferase, partial [Gammaproteobacteria bacterium]|nr:glutathione S-transferase [Gammaproteobacteria bacterium]
MLTLHHLENSRSQRILWLLEELGVDYQVQRYKRDKTTNLAPPELLKVHPLGKSPVITDGEMTVAESGLIVEYLVEKYGKGQLAPAVGTTAHLQYRYWLHYAEGSFMPLMILTLILGRMETAPMPFFAKPIARKLASKARDAYSGPNVIRNLEYLEATLQKSTWFCGDEMTGADIMMSFPVEAAAQR